MRAYELNVLKARLERDGATVGAQIPERLELDDGILELRATVLSLTGSGELEDDDRDHVARLKRSLRHARRARLERLEEPSCTFAEGGAVVDEITGIDRALNALEGIGAPSVEEQARRIERADQRRWMSFLKEALGHEETDGRT